MNYLRAEGTPTRGLAHVLPFEQRDPLPWASLLRGVFIRRSPPHYAQDCVRPLTDDSLERYTRGVSGHLI